MTNVKYVRVSSGSHEIHFKYKRFFRIAILLGIAFVITVIAVIILYSYNDNTAYGEYVLSSHGFRFAAHYQSNMVLQRQPHSNVVWGYGEAGEQVAVKVIGDTNGGFRYYDTTVHDGTDKSSRFIFLQTLLCFVYVFGLNYRVAQKNLLKLIKMFFFCCPRSNLNFEL